jgi:hypothetical protein
VPTGLLDALFRVFLRLLLCSHSAVCASLLCFASPSSLYGLWLFSTFFLCGRDASIEFYLVFSTFQGSILSVQFLPAFFRFGLCVFFTQVSASFFSSLSSVITSRPFRLFRDYNSNHGVPFSFGFIFVTLHCATLLLPPLFPHSTPFSSLESATLCALRVRERGAAFTFVKKRKPFKRRS